MNTQEFIHLLSQNPKAELQFEIEAGKFIQPTYHITEIKNAEIRSVDCGGNKDDFNQTIVQLWVNPKEELRKPWTAEKALSIFKKVDGLAPIDKTAEIFFEYGDSELRTSHFSVQDIEFADDKMNVVLFAKATACKPRLKAASAVSCC